MQLESWLERVDELGPRFVEGVAERDAADRFVAEHYPPLKASGLLTMLVPASLGGGGASHRTACRVLQRLASYDGATALALSMHQHLVAAQVFQHRQGNARAAATLSRVVEHDWVLVSTGARDWLDSTGALERVPGGYRLTARKPFASGAPAGDVAVTSAPFEHPEEGSQVLHFPVPLDAEGVRVGDDWKAHGMRSTGSHTLHFDGVFVPDEAIALRRPRGTFHPVWHTVLTVALPLIASVYVGVAERAAELGRAWARRRADDVETQWATGEMDTALITAQATLEGMVALAEGLDFEPGFERTNRVVALKSATLDAARRSVEHACEAAGGPAYFRRTGLERLLRDVRAGDFHPLRPRAQILLTGRLGLGLDPVTAS